jgi:FAD/FMN-containing dehydrogenase
MQAISWREFATFWQELARYLPLPEVPPAVPPPQPQKRPSMELPLKNSLEKLLGEVNVEGESAVLQRYAGGVDYAGFLRRQSELPAPLIVVHPGSEQEIAELMLWAGARDLQCLPWGGGTRPYESCHDQTERDFIVVDLDRMNRILHLDVNQRTLRAQAGIHWLDLEKSVARSGLTTGQIYPSPYATVGGSIAINSVAYHAQAYGTLTDNLSQIRGVTPSGPVYLQAPPPGTLDTRPIMLGSHGQWGITTEATLSLFPQPEDSLQILASFTSWERAIKALEALSNAHLRLTASRVLSDTLLSLFLVESAPRLLNLVRSARTLAAQWTAHVSVEILGSREQLGAGRSTASKILQEAGGHVSTSDSAPWSTPRWHTERAGLLSQLWPYGILAYTVTAAVPWYKAQAFLPDWEESLSSVLQATGNGQGLALTEIQALTDFALFNTLLIGQAAPGGPAAGLEQLERIETLAEETQRRWNIDWRITGLMHRITESISRVLDPEKVMCR